MTMKYNKSKKAVHFGFSEIDFEKIINLIKGEDCAALLNIAAKNIEPEDADIRKCSEHFLTVLQKGDFLDVEVQKQIGDDTLLPILLSLHEMNPEELCITVVSGADINDIYWDIIVLYDENVATICYDSSVHKKDVVKLFADCFK